jgi:hypothetical protein
MNIDAVIDPNHRRTLTVCRIGGQRISDDTWQVLLALHDENRNREIAELSEQREGNERQKQKRQRIQER